MGHNGVVKSWYAHFLIDIPPIADASKENNVSSSDDDISEVEILSPPRRPVTRSVSAKRGADNMMEDLLSSPFSLPPTKKARREVTGHSKLLRSHTTQTILIPSQRRARQPSNLCLLAPPARKCSKSPPPLTPWLPHTLMRTTFS